MSASPSPAVHGKEDDIIAIKQEDSLIITQSIASEIIGVKQEDSLIILPKRGGDSITVTP